jgi:multidrug efflux pump subunit AcrA (membrane-fusion protein)
VVFGGDPSAVLDNADNRGSGAGQLRAGALTLRNEGVIDANGANALVIDTGTNAVVNTGTIEASGAGGLAPGMSVTAEIRTGERRIISCFLSPLRQYRQDSLRER